MTLAEVMKDSINNDGTVVLLMRILQELFYWLLNNDVCRVQWGRSVLYGRPCYPPSTNLALVHQAPHCGRYVVPKRRTEGLERLVEKISAEPLSAKPTKRIIQTRT